MVIREILVEPQAIGWLPWAVSYFFFIGLAFSCVFVGGWISRANKNIFKEFIAIALAFSCAIVAPIALMADLHQPSRIANFYLHPTAWSWMAWGAVFLPLFTASVGGYFLCLLRQAIPAKKLPKWLSLLYWGEFNLIKWTSVFRWLALLFSVLILLYTTMEVFAVKARPLWHQYGLMMLLLSSVLPTALVLCQSIIYIFDRTFQPKSFTYFSLLCVFGFVGTICYLYLFNEPAKYQLTQLWQFSSLVMTLFFCLALFIVLLFLPSSMWINLLRVFAGLCFTWLFRWILLIQVQGLPKYNASVNFYHLTWQVDGIIGILSVFSLWIFIGILFWQLFYSALVQSQLNGGNNE